MTERPRVLAVDDQPDMLELIRLTLEDSFDVLTLSDPMVVSEYLDLFEPDLLLLDVMMPKLSGFQLLEVLRSRSQTQSLPVIILSAKASMGEIKHGYKIGASLYLTKPFEPERLLRNVRMQVEAAGPPRPKKATITRVAEDLFQTQAYQLGRAELGLGSKEREALRQRESEIRRRYKGMRR